MLFRSREALSRVQLFLCDGDAKIYRAFDKHKRTLFTNAIHSLCIFHLVTKALDETLKGYFCGLSDDKVKNQLATFKAWVFDWMGPGGVEDEDEFQISCSALRSWLKEQMGSGCRNIKSNAKILDEYLVGTLLYHKDRWFFPRRKCLVTFGEKQLQS